MRKNIKLALLIAGILVVAVGCGKSNDSKTGKMAEDTNQSASVNNEETEGKATKGALKLLVENAGDSYDTEEGRYYINTDDEDELFTMRYIDYNAGKEVYLCNKLNCKHNSEDCSAVLSGQSLANDYVMFGDGEYVYLLSTPYDSDGTMGVVTYGEDFGEGMLELNGGEQSSEPPAIYRMNKDGTNREKVFELGSGIIVEPLVIGDGNYLYVVTKRLHDETEGNTTYTSGYDRKLVKIDIEKGTTEDVMDLSGDFKIIGCSKRNIIVSKNDFGREVSVKEQQDDDKYKALYDNSKCIISSINIDSKETKKLKTIKNSNDTLHMEKVVNDKLYISIEEKKYIEIIDLKSGSIKKLNVNDSYSIENIITVKGKGDVIVGMLYSVMGKEDKNGWSNYLINTETGKVTKSTLQTGYKTPISIEAENEDYLYVRSDYRNDTEYVAWVGVNQEYIAEEEYSMISKQDYLANKADYKKVELINGDD